MFKRSIFIFTVSMAVAFTVSADRGGVIKKNKNKPNFNIAMNSSLRNSIGFNLRTGLSYKGSLLVNKNPMMSTSITTYQKGNTIYIVPQKQRIIVPEMKQGYTGLKLILKSK